MKHLSLEVVKNCRMEGKFVVCEHTEEIEEERSLSQARAPPQKRSAGLRVESEETQDYV